MLTLCPGCAEIHDGLGEHCDHCFVHGLSEAGRDRSMALTKWLLPRPTQREYFVQLVELLEEAELVDILMRMFQYLPPIERSVLLNVAAEIAGMQRFPDGKRSRRCRP